MATGLSIVPISKDMTSREESFPETFDGEMVETTRLISSISKTAQSVYLHIKHYTPFTIAGKRGVE